MTGFASSKGRVFMDFDSHKNQEWIRRRKLRIEQVRKQSNEVAKAMRRKVTNEEKARLQEQKRTEEAKFRFWKAEKLDAMERKLRCALEEFGQGHKLALAEPNLNEIIQLKNKINMCKAQERGEIAKQEQEKKKRLENEIKTSSIERKKMTRKLENLRSALICSVPLQKKLMSLKEEKTGSKSERSTLDISKEKIKKKITKPVGSEDVGPNSDRKVRLNKPHRKFYEKPPLNKSPSSKPPLNKPPLNELPPSKPPLNKLPSSKPPLSKLPSNKPASIKPTSSKPPSNKLPSSKRPSSKSPSSKSPSIKSPSIKSPSIKSLSSKPPTNEPPSNEQPLNKPPLNIKDEEPKASKSKDSKILENVESSRDSETFRINLNDIKTQTDPSIKTQSSKKSLKDDKKKNTDRTVFYAYSSRYCSKSFKSADNLVERISPNSEPDAIELARKEEEIKKLEAKKRGKARITALERGIEAFKKERISREYNRLRAKIDELHKKEKLIKIQQRIPCSLVYMNEERLLQNSKAKQKMMESKFEKIYYEATAKENIPLEHSSDVRSYHDSVSDIIKDKENLSPSNLKTNTPAVQCESCTEAVEPTPRAEVRSFSKKRKKYKRKKKLLSDIDKIINEGKELRKMFSQKRETVESENNFRKDSKVESETTSSSALDEFEIDEIPKTSPIESTIHLTDYEINQGEGNQDAVENFNVEDVCSATPADSESLSVDVSANVEEASISLSASTSYKSLPSSFNPWKLHRFLEYLEEMSEDGESVLYSNPKIKQKVIDILKDLLKEVRSSKSEETMQGSSEKSTTTPNLEYYISKLLGLSREYVANLSVSSENVSTPTVTDLENKNGSYQGENWDSITESVCCYDVPIPLNSTREDCTTVPVGEPNVIANKRLELTWKSSNLSTESIEVLECYDKPIITEAPESRNEQKLQTQLYLQGSKSNRNYESLSRKRTERISELASMLSQVRRDKEKLVTSASDTCSFTSINNQLNLRESYYERDQQIPEAKLLRNISPNREPRRPFDVETEADPSSSNSSRTTEDNISVMVTVGTNSLNSLDDSTASSESLPDIMTELLQRNIITSPFKWSQVKDSPEITILDDYFLESSYPKEAIETAIWNFREKMSKIKPFSLEPDEVCIPKNRSATERFSSPDFIPTETDEGGLLQGKESLIINLSRTFGDLNLASYINLPGNK